MDHAWDEKKNMLEVSTPLIEVTTELSRKGGGETINT